MSKERKVATLFLSSIGILGLLFAGLTFADPRQTEIVKPRIDSSFDSLVVPTRVVPTRTPYDYCIFNPQDPDPFSAIAAGTPVPLEVKALSISDMKAIRSSQLSMENIIYPERNNNKYHVLLIPIGYDNPAELKQQIEYLVGISTKIFKDINISFSYLDQSMPLGIQKIDRLLVPTDEKEADVLLEKIREFYRVDNAVIVFNTTDGLGACGNYAVVSGNDQYAASGLAHEQMHKLGFSDGYELFYGEGFAENTELFTSTQSLASLIKVAYDVISPTLRIVSSENVCNGQPVYTFNRYRNVMTSLFSDSELQELFANGENILTPMHVELANRRIKGVLELTF